MSCSATFSPAGDSWQYIVHVAAADPARRSGTEAGLSAGTTIQARPIINVGKSPRYAHFHDLPLVIHQEWQMCLCVSVELHIQRRIALVGWQAMTCRKASLIALFTFTPPDCSLTFVFALVLYHCGWAYYLWSCYRAGFRHTRCSLAAQSEWRRNLDPAEIAHDRAIPFLVDANTWMSLSYCCYFW